MSLFSWLFGTRTPNSPKDFTDDEFQSVALDFVRGKVGYPIVVTGSIEACQRVYADTKALREKYADVQPRRLRHHIMNWLDHYDRNAREVEADLRSGKTAKEMAEYRRQRSAEDERAHALRVALGIRR